MKNPALDSISTFTEVDVLTPEGLVRSISVTIEGNKIISVGEKQGTEIPDFRSNDFIQYMADNVDHNLRTIDGLNSFHRMGIIGTVPPWKKNTKQVPRISGTKEDILSST